MIQADFPRTPSPVVPPRKTQRERSRTSQPMMDDFESPIRPSSTPPVHMLSSPEPALDLNDVMLGMSLNEVSFPMVHFNRRTLSYHPLFNILQLVHLEFQSPNSTIPSFPLVLVPAVHLPFIPLKHLQKVH
jgi:hypothetical protein